MAQTFGPGAWDLVRIALLLALLAAAALTDLRSSRIPNVLTFGGATIALCLAFAVPGPHFAGALIAAVGALLALLPFYALGALGAGDVKLLAMVGAFTGLPLFVSVLVDICLAAGAIALVRAWLHGPQARIPYAVPVAMGTVAALAGFVPL
jgi:prepilin peptidase CpaA